MAEEKKTNAAPVKAVTAVKKDDTKPGFFKRVGKWFREMRSELKKVVWPTRKQLINNTVVSVVVMLISALGVWGFDQIARLLVQGLLGLKG
ncbi:MAG: preprotein translocase subunit SecE [Oscillospiraceae bacterium]|jgi:preprotein translocase subunit SecE|nr:preprotein translocase subunit SecE [Oscillospiraceae bacterium]